MVERRPVEMLTTADGGLRRGFPVNRYNDPRVETIRESPPYSAVRRHSVGGGQRRLCPSIVTSIHSKRKWIRTSEKSHMATNMATNAMTTAAASRRKNATEIMRPSRPLGRRAQEVPSSSGGAHG